MYQICNITKGYPLALSSMVYWLSSCDEPIMEMKNRVYKDVFDYYDEMLFRNWSRELYTFLLQMGGFDSFTLGLASMVTGHPSVRSLIDEADRVGSFLSQKDNEYRIEPFFRKYLRKKQERTFNESAVHNIYHNAGLYYELQSDYKNALKYYSLCQDNGKIHELLTRHSDMHPGIGSYVELEEYYRALPQEEILQSATLMCGMSMLCSMSMQAEESEYWYKELELYCQKLKKSDLQYKYVLGKLRWLDVSLPHRGSVGIEKMLVDIVTKKQNKEVVLREISVTSNLPSVLNGGKDFVRWYPKVDVLYPMLKPIVPLVLGKTGIGLADIALAEVLLETADKDTYKIIQLLNRGIDEAAVKGVIETQYAGIGIMHRLYMTQGNMESAYDILKDFQKMAEMKQQAQILPNLKAEIINYSLRLGKLEKAGIWMKNEAPNENHGYHILERYRYMTKVRCYIIQKKYMEGMSLLNRLIQYTLSYDRTLFRIQSRCLLAVILYRMKEEHWEEVLEAALLEAQEYNIIQTVAEEGAALLPLLQECNINLDKSYKKKLLQYTKAEALLYPAYLKDTSVDTDSLTSSEKQVLKLLGNGMKNKEIAEFLNISLNTVAYHTKNIYQKLGVNNRAQATNIAKSMDF